MPKLRNKNYVNQNLAVRIASIQLLGITLCFIACFFGISACVHPAWTIEEHYKVNETHLLKKNDRIGYKGLWEECLWNVSDSGYSCTSYISSEILPLVNVVLKGCRSMVICFIILSLFGSVVSLVGVQYDYETVYATMLHPNKKYFKAKNILLYLSGTIIVCSSVMMGVACLWYSSMESKYENEENKHEHKTGERAVFRFGTGFYMAMISATVSLSGSVFIMCARTTVERTTSPPDDRKKELVQVYSIYNGEWIPDQRDPIRPLLEVGRGWKVQL